ncbi:MAG TPA: acyltransferase [Arcobacter sp.]|nr:acyltransferase [Arcobacter sp.]
MSNRLEYLDFLRGIAILLVLLTHTHHYFNIPTFNEWAGLGARGVQLFYIVSGFTIYYIYQYKITDINSMKIYIIKRIFRILPLYFLLIPMYYYFFGVYNDYNFDILNIISHYLLLNGFFPEFINSILRVEWSIFDEFIFYFLLVYLFYKYTNFNEAYSLVITLCISLIIAIISFLLLKENLELKSYLYLSPYFQMYNFFIGVYIVTLSSVPNILKYKKSLIILILLFLIIPFYIDSTIIQTYFSSLIFALILINLKFNEYKYNSVIKYIGTISFSIYLIHYFLIMMYARYINHTTLNFIALISIIFLVSIVSYNIIEKKGINIGKRMSKI